MPISERRRVQLHSASPQLKRLRSQYVTDSPEGLRHIEGPEDEELQQLLPTKLVLKTCRDESTAAHLGVIPSEVCNIPMVTNSPTTVDSLAANTEWLMRNEADSDLVSFSFPSESLLN